MKVWTIVALAVVLLAAVLVQPSVGGGMGIKRLALAAIIAKTLKPRFVPLPIPLPFPLKFTKDSHGKPYPVHSHSHSAVSQFVPSHHHGHDMGGYHMEGFGHGGLGLEHGLGHVHGGW